MKRKKNATLATISDRKGIVISIEGRRRKLSFFKDFDKYIVQCIEEGILANDAEGYIIFVNPKMAQMLGYSEQELLGKHWKEIVPRAFHKKVEEETKKRPEGKKSSYEICLLSKNGKEIPVIVSAVPIIRKGRYAGDLAAFTDITERKKAEEELARQKEKLNTLLANMPEGVVIENRNFEIEYANEPLIKAFGNIIGKKCYRVFIGRDKPCPVCPIKEILIKEKNIKTMRYEAVDRFGNIYELIASPIKNPDGTTSILEVARNITEEKKAEEKINYMNKLDHCKSVISTKFVMEKDVDKAINDALKILGETVKVNRVYLYLIREREGVTVADNTHEWCSRGTTPQIKKMKGLKPERFPWWTKQLRENKPIVVSDVSELPPEAEAERKLQESQDVRSLVVVPIYLEGKPKGFIGFDDTEKTRKWKDEEIALLRTVAGIIISAIERKQAEKMLEEYTENLEKLVEERTRELKASQEKLLKAQRMATIGEIAAMVGHDLRNPLTGIAGAVYYLKMRLGSKLDDKSKEMLEIIEKDVEYSNKIISDLLDMSKEIVLELTEASPSLLIEEALSQIEVPKNIRVVNQTQSKPKIRVDKDKMKRVFLNIIRNAFDAMPKGGKLEIHSEEKDCWLEITFRDTGVGMSQEVLKKIWKPFFTTKAKGMGLGLSISKRIVEAHGGCITVRSKKGKGTCFTVKIPISQKRGEEHERNRKNLDSGRRRKHKKSSKSHT